jgi:hypothetical protein
MAAKIYLTVVDDAGEGDTILQATKLPLFRGHDKEENLACGSCKAVVASNASTRSIHERFATAGRLILRCTCGADNLLPSQQA